MQNLLSITYNFQDLELTTLSLTTFYQTVDFNTKDLDSFILDSQLPHLQRYLHWIPAQVEQVRRSHFKGQFETRDLKAFQPHEEIATFLRCPIY